MYRRLKKYGNKKWSLNFHDKPKNLKSYILLFCTAQDYDQAISHSNSVLSQDIRHCKKIFTAF